MMGYRQMHQLCCDVWKLYQKFFQQDLELFADAADKIAEKYKHDPVAEKMILAVAEELERKTNYDIG